MKKQAIIVSPNELRELAENLESEIRQLNLELGIDEIHDFNKKFQISIINKTPECSDTWEFEK